MSIKFASMQINSRSLIATAERQNLNNHRLLKNIQIRMIMNNSLVVNRGLHAVTHSHTHTHTHTPDGWRSLFVGKIMFFIFFVFFDEWKKKKKNLTMLSYIFFYVLWCASYSLSGFEVKNLMIILVTLLSLPFPPPLPPQLKKTTF